VGGQRAGDRVSQHGIPEGGAHLSRVALVGGPSVTLPNNSVQRTALRAAADAER